ncbi:MAG: AMP-binding protein, partial [Burkholderiales bacterium]|nr:AMP-binding protein [Burkholderiales bacterium]
MLETSNSQTLAQAGGVDVAAPALLAIVEATLRDLHAGAPGMPSVTLQSVLDRDLGLDSLARMELLLRTEREFGVALPEDTLQRSESVGDLLDAVSRALASAPPADRPLAAPGLGQRTAFAPPAALAPTASTPPADVVPSAASTLIDVLNWHLEKHPDQTQVICLDGDTEQVISYRGLAQSAAAIAAGLQRAGVRPRQCVAIMLPTSPEYFGTYFGILLAGAIPVPSYPPARASQLEDHVLRHTGILANAQVCVLVTVAEAMVVARLLQARVPGLRHVLTA